MNSKHLPDPWHTLSRPLNYIDFVARLQAPITLKSACRTFVFRRSSTHTAGGNSKIVWIESHSADTTGSPYPPPPPPPPHPEVSSSEDSQFNGFQPTVSAAISQLQDIGVASSGIMYPTSFRGQYKFKRNGEIVYVFYFLDTYLVLWGSAQPSPFCLTHACYSWLITCNLGLVCGSMEWYV